jgi:hypothetical protein
MPTPPNPTLSTSRAPSRLVQSVGRQTCFSNERTPELIENTCSIPWVTTSRSSSRPSADHLPKAQDKKHTLAKRTQQTIENKGSRSGSTDGTQAGPAASTPDARRPDLKNKKPALEPNNPLKTNARPQVQSPEPRPFTLRNAPQRPTVPMRQSVVMYRAQKPAPEVCLPARGHFGFYPLIPDFPTSGAPR